MESRACSTTDIEYIGDSLSSPEWRELVLARISWSRTAKTRKEKWSGGAHRSTETSVDYPETDECGILPIPFIMLCVPITSG